MEMEKKQCVILGCCVPPRTQAEKGVYRLLWYSFNAFSKANGGGGNTHLRPLIQGPDGRCAYKLSCSSVGLKLFVVGGSSDSVLGSNRVFSYDLNQLDSDSDSNSNWKEVINPMIVPRVIPLVASHNDKLYMFNSISVGGTPNVFAEVYDVQTNKYTPLPLDYPHKVCTSHFGFIYQDSFIWCSFHCIYSLDFKTHKWTDITKSHPSLGIKSRPGTCQVLNDILYKCSDDQVLAYDLKLKEWFPDPVLRGDENQDCCFDKCFLVELEDHPLSLVCLTSFNTYSQVFCMTLQVVSGEGEMSLSLKPTFISQTFTAAGFPLQCLAPEGFTYESKVETGMAAAESRQPEVETKVAAVESRRPVGETKVAAAGWRVADWVVPSSALCFFLYSVVRSAQK